MPPVVAGGALVIPRGLMDKLIGRVDQFAVDAIARRKIELAAMKAVMEIETSLGFIPLDVSELKCGYDIESRIPQEKRNLEFICSIYRSKGRIMGDNSDVSKKRDNYGI
jgi:hypothetical protein